MKKFHHAVQLFLNSKRNLFYDFKYNRWLVSHHELNKYNAISLTLKQN